jgi:hypothetical protein
MVKYCQSFLKGVLKFTLKHLQHVLVYSPSSRSALFQLVKVTFVKTLASSNSVLPDDGDYTETCWCCFNVNHARDVFSSTNGLLMSQ